MFHRTDRRLSTAATLAAPSRPLAEPLEARQLMSAALVTQVLPDVPGRALGPSAAAGSAVYFVADADDRPAALWRSDGTTAGTAAVLTPDPTDAGSTIAGLTTVGTTAYFFADDPAAPGGGLWASDGSAAGTSLVAKLTTDDAAPLPAATFALAGGQRFAFFVSRPGEPAQLYASDGSAAGTTVVWTAPAAAAAVGDAAVTPDGRVLFAVADPANPAVQSLWVADAAGATKTADAPAGAAEFRPRGFAFAGGRAYFAADAANTLWAAATDGVAPTAAVGTGGQPIRGSAADPVAFGGKVLFAERDAAGRYVPVLTDGTTAGTVPLLGSAALDAVKGYHVFTPTRAFVWAHASASQPGRDTLYVTDGTAAGTSSWVSGQGVVPQFAAGGRLYYHAPSESQGVELWATNGRFNVTHPDGTQTYNTEMVQDLKPGTGSGRPTYLGEVGANVLLAADDAGTAVWNLDPTVRPARVSGTVFRDTNRNGVREPWEWPESALAYLDLNGSGGLDADEPTTPSYTNQFSFVGLPAGRYTVRFAPRGIGPLPPTTLPGGEPKFEVDLAPGQDLRDLDPGFDTAGNAVYGFVFEDADRDGVRDPNERPHLTSPTHLFLARNGNRVFDAGVDQTPVTSQGYYEFTHLEPGTYTLWTTGLLKQYEQTTPTPTWEGIPVTVAAGGVTRMPDIGANGLWLWEEGRAGARVYNDWDRSGTLTDGDTPIDYPQPDRVYLDLNNNRKLDEGVENWGTGGLSSPPGEYLLRLPAVDDGTAELLSPSDGGSIRVTAGRPAPAVLTYTRAPYTVAGTSFDDRDADGVRDPGEPGLAGRTVFVDRDREGALDADERRTTTGPGGEYAFADAQPWSHLVRQVMPAGWVPSWFFEPDTVAPSAAVPTAVRDLPTTRIYARPADQQAVAGTAQAFDLGRYRRGPSPSGLIRPRVVIDWGDGTAAETVDRFPGLFDSLGTQPHTYAAAGTYTVRVALTEAVAGGRTLDADAFAVVVAPPPPRVESVGANGTSAQRSAIGSALLRFDQPVTLDPGGFELARRGGADPAGAFTVAEVVPTDGGRAFTVRFGGPGLVGGSLPDGVYDLRVRATAAGAPAGVAAAAADLTVSFHRLYSDADGDGDSDNADLFQFRGSYGKSAGDPAYKSEFDHDGDGDVDNADLFQVRSRRGVEYKGY